MKFVNTCTFTLKVRYNYRYFSPLMSALGQTVFSQLKIVHHSGNLDLGRLCPRGLCPDTKLKQLLTSVNLFLLPFQGCPYGGDPCSSSNPCSSGYSCQPYNAIQDCCVVTGPPAENHGTQWDFKLTDKAWGTSIKDFLLLSNSILQQISYEETKIKYFHFAPVHP